MTNNDIQNTTQKTKDQTTRTPQKAEELSVQLCIRTSVDTSCTKSELCVKHH